MAQIKVVSDDGKTTVDITFDQETDTWSAICSGCLVPGTKDEHADLVDDARDRFNFEDTTQVASIHLDYNH